MPETVKGTFQEPTEVAPFETRAELCLCGGSKLDAVYQDESGICRQRFY
jgi:hypothetical protein